MKLSTLKRIPQWWRARAMRVGFNHNPAFRRKFTIELKDKSGTLYTVVERLVYIADKAYYKQKFQKPGVQT